MKNEEHILQLLIAMQQDMTGLKQDMTEVKQDISGLKQDMTEVKQDISGLKQDMTEVKQDISGLKQDVALLREHIDTQTLRLDLKIENDVVQCLHSLYDGYMLNRDMHEILEHRVDAVEERVDRLEIAAS